MASQVSYCSLFSDSCSSMRDRGTESESTVVRKRPAQSEDETIGSESGALPATIAESEMSPSASTTNPQQAIPAEESQPSHPESQQVPSADESQTPQATFQQVGQPVEELTSVQSGESSIRESSGVKKRVVGTGMLQRTLLRLPPLTTLGLSIRFYPIIS